MPKTPLRTDQPVGANPYGRFIDPFTYRIVDYRTPRPWSNIIANRRFGLAVSQTGSGFTWVDNSQLAVLTRWEQEFTRDSSGKFLYLREGDRIWSLAPAPTFPVYDEFACEHAVGRTTFHTRLADLSAEWTLHVDAQEAIEYWTVRLTNHSRRHRRLELTAFLEWCCGVAPSPRREFHKLFIETRFHAERQAIFAANHMWDVASERFGHWNSDFPYHAAIACSEPVFSAQGDKTEFFGRNGDWARPAALLQDTWKPRFGRHGDAVAALRSVIELRPEGTQELAYVLAVDGDLDTLHAMLERSCSVSAARKSLARVEADWRERLGGQRVETPDASIDYLSNVWLPYQAISGRIWGRCGYYQQSGAFGFRDQLQDSQIWLPSDPQLCRAQLSLHAAHQFADGSVYHWWHPLSEQGHVTRMTDDLLWLSFVTAAYLRETGDFSVLSDEAPFLDDPRPAPLHEHVRRAFERVFQRTSPRGLPYIGAGDWNDGLSACGLEERGESIWLGHFLAGLLTDWCEILHRWKDDDVAAKAFRARAGEFAERRERLMTALNEHGWDGKWYFRATLDDGSRIGSAQNRVGQIYLNAQTWAILNDVAPPDRAAMCLAAIRQRLVSKAGALLLAPAYDRPDERIGYITRYAPGLRENGGVYTHAATWAIAAAARMRDAALVQELLTAINPTNKNPDEYWAEPYVLPGNVDGPDSPQHGRGGWTWYTGSASWLQRVITHYVLGVRPDWDGLLIDPCLPANWKQARYLRQWRGVTYDIQIERDETMASGHPTRIESGGSVLPSNVIPPPTPAQLGTTVPIRATCR